MCVCVCLYIRVCMQVHSGFWNPANPPPPPPHLTLFQTRPTNEEYPIMQNPPKCAHTSTVPDPLAIHMQMHIYKAPHLT